MLPRRELLGPVALAAALAGAAGAEPAREPPQGGALFDAGALGNRKEPITITSDTLEYDYKNGVVVYRGDVLAVQGEMKVRSDTMTITFEKKTDPKAPPDPPPAGKGHAAHPAPDFDSKGSQKVHEIVAVGNVRIDQGLRWATGGRATFEQTDRTLVLTESPILHQGPNEVAGDRVIVYLDEDRSIVEGGRKRVKAVLYPGKDNGLVSDKADGSAPAPEQRAAEAPTP